MADIKPRRFTPWIDTALPCLIVLAIIALAVNADALGALLRSPS